MKDFLLINDDCLKALDKLEENSVDAIVTDPPYGLVSITKRFGKEGSSPAKYGKDGSFARLSRGFMGKEWDGTGIEYSVELWEKCLRVLKPGGYLLSFGGTRTFHRIACAIEDAGFEIRDCIMWIYGCLSEDTEILTEGGFKPYHKITKNDKIAIYDTTKRVFKWEIPQRWQAYDVEQDTAYRIKSDSTDQIVSRNHRCIVEQNGKLVFKFAENLSEMERVPILPQDFCIKTERRGEILQLSLCGENENLVKTVCQQRKGQEEPQERVKNGKKPCLEGGGDISQKEGKLCLSKDKVCEMPEGVCDNGEKRWLCNGTQADSGEGDRATIVKNRGCSSYKSQCGGQQNRKLNAIQEQPRPQEIRTQTEYTTTLATIEKIEYTGVLFCPTVSTGAFVARRNGKVFITGNSGMPKSLNIGLALDKKLGKESIDTGVVSPNARPNAKKENSLYNSGKVGKTFTLKKATNEWEGWGTGLKPAYEPIIMARKPFKGTLVDNVLENGVGGINIEECRVPLNNGEMIAKNVGYTDQKQSDGWGVKRCITEQSSQGRHPADLILTYDENNKDEVYGGFPESKGGSSAARYFYCAKASSRDRDEGLEHFVPKEGHSKGNGLDRVCEFCGTPQLKAELCKCPTKSWVAKPKRNTHPTVKPTSLMQYLVRLVTPKGGVVLDPFMGSGSTGKAVAFENKDRDAHYKFIGIEKELEYYELSEARIEWAQRTNP